MGSGTQCERFKNALTYSLKSGKVPIHSSQTLDAFLGKLEGGIPGSKIAFKVPSADIQKHKKKLLSLVIGFWGWFH